MNHSCIERRALLPVVLHRIFFGTKDNIVKRSFLPFCGRDINLLDLNTVQDARYEFIPRL